MGEETLTLEPAELDDAARAAYAIAYRKGDTSGGLASVDELLRGAELFQVRGRGEHPVVRYALRVDQKAHGREGVIVAAAGRLPGRDLTATFIPVIEKQFEGVDAVRVTTKRKALVNKLLQMGYELDAFTLRKRLK